MPSKVPIQYRRYDPDEPAPLCLCGCGQQVVKAKHNNYFYNYVRNHHRSIGMVDVAAFRTKVWEIMNKRGMQYADLLKLTRMPPGRLNSIMYERRRKYVRREYAAHILACLAGKATVPTEVDRKRFAHQGKWEAQMRVYEKRQRN